MKAWVATVHGDFREVLRLEDLPEPASPGPAEAIVRVHAAGVNFADILAIAGRYQEKAEPPFVPGSEIAGEVIVAGSGSWMKAGDRVLASPRSGGFAEVVTVADHAAYHIPERVDLLDAAAMLVTYQTSHVALLRRAGLQTGETLLVHGGAGGAGTSAIQIGLRAGARVIATAGGEDKVDVCSACGAQEVIDYRRDDFVERVVALTDRHGADVIYDPVGGDVFDGSTRCIAWEGRLLTVGYASGRIPEIAANRVLLKNISVVGVNWPGYRVRNRSVLERAQEDIWRGYAEGQLRPVIWKTLPFGGLPDALSAIQSRESYGKIVIDLRA
jgi:NADPH2:quinone reductase